MPGTTRKRKSWEDNTPQYRKKRIRQVGQMNKIAAIDTSGKRVMVKQVSSEGSPSS